MEAHWILLSLALLSAATAAAALVRREKPVPPFWRFGGALASELPLFLAASMLLGLGGMVVFTPALQHEAGRLGAFLLAASLVGLGVVHLQVWRTRSVVDDALRADLGPEFDRSIPVARRCLLAARTSLRAALRPIPSLPRDVELVADIPYPGGHERNTLDLYRQAAGCVNAPVLLYLHGNEWSKGHKRQQALPLLHELAALGWVVVAPNYRLSPGARFPAQLIDCKSAFAWIRAHVAAYGGDPHRVAVAGGSAGAHLAALIALTHDVTELQPGFEHVNTKPTACVTLYGAYDFTDRHGCRRDGRSYVKWLGANIMPCPLDRDPAAWESASPMAQVRADAPPCFILHGTHDAMVPAREARSFAEHLRAVSVNPVVYAELPGAHHGWDQWQSTRTLRSVDGIVRFLEWCVTREAVTDSPRDGNSANHARS